MFEWDEAKRLANLAKHRLDFVDAVSSMVEEGWTILPAFSGKNDA